MSGFPGDEFATAGPLRLPALERARGAMGVARHHRQPPKNPCAAPPACTSNDEGRAPCSRARPRQIAAPPRPHHAVGWFRLDQAWQSVLELLDPVAPESWLVAPP